MVNKYIIILFLTLSTYANKNIIFDTISINPDTIIVCTVLTPKGNIFKTYKKKNGELHGKFIKNYMSGELKESFKYSNGCLVDSGFVYYEDGAINMLSYNKGCNKRGWSVSYFKNGDTSIISTPKLTKIYYQDQTPKSIIHYNDSGKKHGLCQTWRKDGTRKDSTVYDNGEIVEERLYFTNGNLRSHNFFKNGQPVKWTAWDPEGNKIQTIKNGTGKGIHYSRDGKTRYLSEYKNGKVISNRILNPGEDPEITE